MSKPSKKLRGKGKKERNITIRSVRRDEPDYRGISQVLIQLAMAQAEADAQALHGSTPVDLPARDSLSSVRTRTVSNNPQTDSGAAERDDR
jgi:hypothetical protein